jgi:hypothetical protein
VAAALHALGKLSVVRPDEERHVVQVAFGVEIDIVNVENPRAFLESVRDLLTSDEARRSGSHADEVDQGFTPNMWL